jgi:hypothetical protein
MLSLAVAFVCLIPLGGTHAPRVPYVDKYIHVFLFASLTFIWARGFNKQNAILFLQQNAKKSAALFCFSYGVLIEILQELMQLGRAFELLDIAADALGVVLSILLLKVLRMP